LGRTCETQQILYLNIYFGFRTSTQPTVLGALFMPNNKALRFPFFGLTKNASEFVFKLLPENTK